MTSAHQNPASLGGACGSCSPLCVVCGISSDSCYFAVGLRTQPQRADRLSPLPPAHGASSYHVAAEGQAKKRRISTDCCSCRNRDGNTPVKGRARARGENPMGLRYRLALSALASHNSSGSTQRQFQAKGASMATVQVPAEQRFVLSG